MMRCCNMDMTLVFDEEGSQLYWCPECGDKRTAGIPLSFMEWCAIDPEVPLSRREKESRERCRKYVEDMTALDKELADDDKAESGIKDPAIISHMIGSLGRL